MLEELRQQVEEKSYLISRIRQEIDKLLVGQRKLVDGLLMGLLTKGHILIEGVPGLAKTSAVKALAAANYSNIFDGSHVILPRGETAVQIVLESRHQVVGLLHARPIPAPSC